jgi:hypothetical protein
MYAQSDLLRRPMLIEDALRPFFWDGCLRSVEKGRGKKRMVAEDELHMLVG